MIICFYGWNLRTVTCKYVIIYQNKSTSRVQSFHQPSPFTTMSPTLCHNNIEMNGTHSEETKRYYLNNQTGQQNIFSNVQIVRVASVQKYDSSNDLVFYKMWITIFWSVEKYAVLTWTMKEMISHVTKMTAIRCAEINDGWSTKVMLHMKRI
jgi:hypothetical protein